jgi:hypothetical protein
LTSEYITNAEYEVKSHILSIPTVLTPNGGETIVGSYDITWTESVESWGLQVVYDVYYSADAGETWTEIINTLEYTSIDWDVRGLPDGDQYLIRIVARGTSGLVTEDVSDSTFIISRANYTIIIASVAGIAFVIAIVAYGLRKRGTI